MKIEFVPTKCEGIADVSKVEVYSDRMVIIAQGGEIELFYSSLAKWPKPVFLSKLLTKIWIWPSFLPVADRDWFNAPGKRYFEFYTSPRIKLYVPDTEEMGYGDSIFFKVREVIENGKYSTFDLG
jgi:hypothetical protein